MQALNIKRTLVQGLASNRSYCFLFEGTIPSSTSDLSFNFYDLNTVLSQCLYELQINDTKVIPLGSDCTVQFESFSTPLNKGKEPFTDTEDLDEDGIEVSKSIPGVTFRAGSASTDSHDPNWTAHRTFGHLTSDSGSSIMGTTDAEAFIYFGNERDVSGVHLYQDLDLAEISNDVFRNSYAQTVRVWRREYSEELSEHEWILVGDFSGLGVGRNSFEFEQDIQTDALKIRAIVGTGSNAAGVSSFRAPRAEWRLRKLSGFTRSIIAGRNVVPTWALVYLTPTDLSSLSDIENVEHPYIDNFSIPMIIVDVGAQGSGATIELTDYPLAPGSNAQIHKFNLKISE